MATLKNFFAVMFFSVILTIAFSMSAFAAPFDDASAAYVKTLAFGRTLVTSASAPKNSLELARALYRSLPNDQISREGAARVVAQTLYELGADFKLGFTVTPRDAVAQTLRVLEGDLSELKTGVNIPIFTNTTNRTTYGKNDGGVECDKTTVQFTVADIGTGQLSIVGEEEPVSAG